MNVLLKNINILSDLKYNHHSQKSYHKHFINPMRSKLLIKIQRQVLRLEETVIKCFHLLQANEDKFDANGSESSKTIF